VAFSFSLLCCLCVKFDVWSVAQVKKHQLQATMSAESKENDTPEFERHLPRNNNTYPLDAKLCKNHLSHLTRWDYLVKRDCIEQTHNFEKKYCFDKIMYERKGFKIVYLNNCNFVVRIYDTEGELSKFDDIYRNAKRYRSVFAALSAAHPWHSIASALATIPRTRPGGEMSMVSGPTPADCQCCT